MKNSIICKNCGAENPFYELTCKNCKAYLRERVFNIDLWQTISDLVENPKKSFSNIILAEHKNFIVFIILLVSAKFLIDAIFLSLYLKPVEPNFSNVFAKYVSLLFETVIIISFLAFIIKVVSKIFNFATRFKDNFAIIVYSYIPHAFGLILLFTVEVTVFGGNIFSNNPSPFVLKEFLAFVLTGFEVLIILWSLFLSIMSFYTQQKKMTYAIITAVVVNTFIFYNVYLNSLRF